MTVAPHSTIEYVSNGKQMPSVKVLNPVRPDVWDTTFAAQDEGFYRSTVYGALARVFKSSIMT